MLTVVDGRKSEIAVNWFDSESPRVHHNMIFSENVHVSNLFQWIAGPGNVYVNFPSKTAQEWLH